MYVAGSRTFNFDDLLSIFMHRLFACTSTVVFVLCFCFPQSVAADYYLIYFVLVLSSLHPIQSYKTKNQRAYDHRGDSDNIYETVKRNTG